MNKLVRNMTSPGGLTISSFEVSFDKRFSLISSYVTFQIEYLFLFESEFVCCVGDQVYYVGAAHLNSEYILLRTTLVVTASHVENIFYVEAQQAITTFSMFNLRCTRKWI